MGVLEEEGVVGHKVLPLLVIPMLAEEHKSGLPCVSKLSTTKDVKVFHQ